MKGKDIVITEVYSPNDSSSDEEKTNFYDNLKTLLDKKLTQIDDSTPTKLYDGLVKSIHQAAEESLGELDNGRNKKSLYCWNDSIKESLEEKKGAYNKWLTTKDLEDRKYYRRISREVKKEIIKRKNEFWDTKCEEVGQYLGSSRSRESWRLLKNLRTNENSRTSLQPISMSEWELYYKQQMKEDRVQFERTELELNEQNTEITKNYSTRSQDPDLLAKKRPITRTGAGKRRTC
ncbi:hypothetical protein HHI36_012275 [Cryptolaemus montrouzieri]|uniref:Uncharacterized protein n=1 Tax=Cryptolaemus montrouzieri TaxID=559131 RepID=A0ABD2NDZ2_9CUCU